MQNILNSINWEFAIRLLVAGFCGILIGLEREYRAKEAGYRTHFLVCLGSALMMLISKYAFWDLMEGSFVGVGNKAIDYEHITSALRIDPARIAAGVVTGIGFIGAGTIILQRQVVRGLTTAAGIWATAGIGMGVGAGMYVESIIATILVLAGLEILTLIFRGLSVRALNLEFEVGQKETLSVVEELLSDDKYIVASYKVIDEKEDKIIVETTIKLKNRKEESKFFSRLTAIDGLFIRRID